MSEVMLPPPQCGWSELHMGTWSDRLSYLDDPAFDLLWAVERVLRTSQPSAVKFDAEGHEYTIVFDRYDQFIITGGDTFTLTHVDMKLEDVAAGLARDIRKDIDRWAAFPVRVEVNPKEIEDRQVTLENLLSIVEKKL